MIRIWQKQRRLRRGDKNTQKNYIKNNNNNDPNNHIGVVTHLMMDILECEVRLAIGSIAIVQLPSCVQLFLTPWTAALKASLSLTSPEVCPSSCPLHLWCHASISSSDSFFFFFPQSFPASASVLPMSIYGLFPLRLTGLISLMSKGLSGAFSSTTVWRYQFFRTPPSL